MQVSHTLLSLMDSKTGQPFSDTQKRLQVLTRMLQSALSQSFNGMTPMKVSHEVPMLVSKGINIISMYILFSQNRSPQKKNIDFFCIEVINLSDPGVISLYQLTLSTNTNIQS